MKCKSLILNHMKIIYKIVFFFLLVLSPFTTFWWSIFDDDNTSVHYCSSWWCWLSNGVESVWAWISDLVTNKGFSDYIQEIVIFVISFISIIAVIYLIYAGFLVLTSAWDEEKVTKTKKIMIYVILWIIIIWLAWPILSWVLWILNWDSNCDMCYNYPSWSERNQCFINYWCISIN